MKSKPKIPGAEFTHTKAMPARRLFFAAGNKGQSLAIDLLIAIMIFMLLMAAILAIWSNSADIANKQLAEGGLQQTAEKAMEMLIGGNVSQISDCNSAINEPLNIAKADRMLDEAKVNQFIWATANLPNRAISVWHLNGDVLDANRFSAYDGTAQGSPGLNGTGVCATNAASFSYPNSSQYINIGDKTYLKFTDNNFSISFWFKTSNTTKVMVPIAKGNTAAFTPYLLQLNYPASKNIIFYAANSACNSWLSSPGDLIASWDNDVWVHIVV
ncbi:MAG: hypothetical protein NTW59_01725, partial [Candidatus Diapherotrites archaeon]|nr:hypothetical protein [Candidatus Diapherotrites archaeon]